MKWKKILMLVRQKGNPGDKERTIDKIIKVVSGDSKKTLGFL